LREFFRIRKHMWEGSPYLVAMLSGKLRELY